MLQVFKKKKILMYGKPGMTYFEYQMYLHDSIATTYLKVILSVVTEPAL
jgi:hypothetical protein